ncbi:HPr kinase/phosphorylase [Aquamicrobium terrae]
MSASGPAAGRTNIHATAVLAGDRGILITGPSGAGKSTLAIALIGRLRAGGRFARLVADDQLFVSGHGGRLVCHAPPAISGLVEVFGLGPRELASEPAAVIDLVGRLVPAGAVARMQEEASEVIAGCRVPRIDLPAGDVISAAQMLISWLRLPPFSGN